MQGKSLEEKKMAAGARQTWRPKSISQISDVLQCPYCNADIKASYVICPHCGRSLTPGKCSFCGKVMKESARFCSHCGQSRDGIICPECGTLNSRNFCRKCNAPLTEMAQTAISGAQADPEFKVIRNKAEELRQLHLRIEELKNAANSNEESPQLSAADQALLDEYAAILGAVGASHPEQNVQQIQETKTRPEYADTTMSLDEMMTAYREKVEEMNAALAALTPPPDFTPEQQRDYYSARKIVTVEHEYDMSGYTPSEWVCNYCGAHHSSPSDCAEPQLGGTWIYTTPEQYIEKNKANIITHSTLKIN